MKRTKGTTISVCIPTYEMNGLGSKYLEHSFKILLNQTYSDFDIVISDHSTSDTIKILCDKYKQKLDIKYYKNTHKRGSSSANINNAIRKARGNLIKILFQDDYLCTNTALEKTVNSFNMHEDNWLITACEHTHDGKTYFKPFYPMYNNDILIGNNTISSPSVLTIKNDKPLLFDENLIWLMDCDYYKRWYDKFGLPKIYNGITVVNRVGKHQVSNTTATQSLRKSEYAYIVDKYKSVMNLRQKLIVFIKYRVWSF